MIQYVCRNMFCMRPCNAKVLSEFFTPSLRRSLSRDRHYSDKLEPYAAQV